jgi:hypothetical protein
MIHRLIAPIVGNLRAVSAVEKNAQVARLRILEHHMLSRVLVHVLGEIPPIDRFETQEEKGHVIEFIEACHGAPRLRGVKTMTIHVAGDQFGDIGFDRRGSGPVDDDHHGCQTAAVRRERVEQAIGLHTRQAEHCVDAVTQQDDIRVDGRRLKGQPERRYPR